MHIALENNFKDNTRHRMRIYLIIFITETLIFFISIVTVIVEAQQQEHYWSLQRNPPPPPLSLSLSLCGNNKYEEHALDIKAASRLLCFFASWFHFHSTFLQWIILIAHLTIVRHLHKIFAPFINRKMNYYFIIIFINTNSY